MTIPLSAPDIGDREIDYVTDVLRSSHLSLGPQLARFEEQFAEYVGARYAVAANSGTSALHMCVRALGIESGEEAITTSFSFVASANCLLYEGATPCFLDIQAQTLNLDPEVVASFLREHCKKTAKGFTVNKATGRPIRAILPVHVFGLSCDMSPLVELAQEYNLLILEDACEAIGAEYCGRRVGTFGNAAVFAFYPNKQITTGEGGMIVTNDSKLADFCRSLRNQGRDVDGRWLKHIRLGYNYRMSDIHAALGLAQLERLEDILAARANVARTYSEMLAGIESLNLPAEVPGHERSWFVYVVQLRGPSPRALRDRLQAHLQSKGIGCQVYFPAIHRQPYFQEFYRGSMPALPNTEAAADSCLALPFWSRLTKTQVRFVCDEITRVLEPQKLQQPAKLAPPESARSVTARF